MNVVEQESGTFYCVRDDRAEEGTVIMTTNPSYRHRNSEGVHFIFEICGRNVVVREQVLRNANGGTGAVARSNPTTLPSGVVSELAEVGYGVRFQR